MSYHINNIRLVAVSSFPDLVIAIDGKFHFDMSIEPM